MQQDLGRDYVIDTARVGRHLVLTNDQALENRVLLGSVEGDPSCSVKLDPWHKAMGVW